MFLYSALSNLYNQNKEPYPTAKFPGAEPISGISFDAARKWAHRQVSQEEAAVNSTAVSSREGKVLRVRRVYTRARPLPIAELHLTTKLANSTFLGGYRPTFPWPSLSVKMFSSLSKVQ